MVRPMDRPTDTSSSPRDSGRPRLLDHLPQQDSVDAQDILDSLNRAHKQSPVKLEHAEELLRAMNVQNGTVRIEELAAFLSLREQELWDIFQQIQGTSSHDMHPDELRASLLSAGIALKDEEFTSLVSYLDANRDGLISFTEWRDFLLLLPRQATLHSIVHYWKCVTEDFNSDATAPLDALHYQSSRWVQFKYFMAGGMAGAVSRTVTAPLDRVRVLLQTQTWSPRARHRTWKETPFVKAARKIYANGGVTAFYRGNGLNIVKIFPESAIKFYVFEYAKNVLASVEGHGNVDNLHVASRFAAGGLAGLVSQFAIYPLETLKTRMMAEITQGYASVIPIPAAKPDGTRHLHTCRLYACERAHYSSLPRYRLDTSSSLILKTMSKMWAEGGLRTFYRGCGPALVGIVPYAGIDLAVFETLKTTWTKVAAEKQQDTRPPIAILLASGMISGTVGATIMYPLSLVRTRLQAQGTPSHPMTYTSSFDVIRKTYAKESWSGFYRGLAPTLLKVVPAVSITYVAYEESKRFLHLK